MTHLIKLELKKFGIKRNIIFTVAAILFSILFITVSLWDSATDPQQTKDTFESTYLVIGLMMSFIFLVYSSILTSQLVIGEYNQRTITIMFSYPLNRRELIAAKLIIIMFYTAISMTVGYHCCCGYIVFIDRRSNWLAGTFQISMLQAWIPMAISSVIVGTLLTLWPFIIGMLRKSIPDCITTSFVVLVIRQVIISKNMTNNYQESLIQILFTAFITFAAALFIFKKKVPELY
jgi:ABC-type transport system involved in multi-copper enzyme maturation permease subunit